MNIFKKAYLTVKLGIWRLSAGMVRVEEDILKPKDLTITNEKNKHQIKAPIRNKTLAKMDKGVKDEKFAEDFYEILKKGDEFLEKADPEKIAQIALKNGMNMGLKLDKEGLPIPFKTDEDGKVIKDKQGIPVQKDEFGRRYDNYGFFDPKHKHYGKTIREVTLAQVEERRLKDDDFPIEFMINNYRVVKSMTEEFGHIRDRNVDGNEALTPQERAAKEKFPIKIVRKNDDAVNKIEQLIEFLHIKRIDETHRIMEFFIPKKFKTNDYDIDSKLIKELIDIQQVWHVSKYGDRYGFAIDKLYKRIDTEKHDIIKFNANVIEKIN